MKIKLSILTKDELVKLANEIQTELAGREERIKHASRMEEVMKVVELVEPVYVHPVRPNLIWGGRGRPPSWMVELLDSGYAKEELRVFRIPAAFAPA